MIWEILVPPGGFSASSPARPEIMDFWDEKWSDDIPKLATRKTHGYSMPTKYEGERTTLKLFLSSKLMI